MILGRDIGKKSGLFVVPKVLDLDKKSGKLVMERLKPLRPIRYIKGRTQSELNFFKYSGRALAKIHECLILPENSRFLLPNYLASDEQSVCLHGDFTKSNVGIFDQEHQKSIAVIDWQMTAIHGGKASWGTPYFDLGWFISGLFLESPLRHSGQWNLAEKAEHFLLGYVGDSIVELPKIVAYLKRLDDVRSDELRTNPRLFKRLGLKIGMMKWRAFISLLESRLKHDLLPV